MKTLIAVIALLAGAAVGGEIVSEYQAASPARSIDYGIEAGPVPGSFFLYQKAPFVQPKGTP